MVNWRSRRVGRTDWSLDGTLRTALAELEQTEEYKRRCGLYSIAIVLCGVWDLCLLTQLGEGRAIPERLKSLACKHLVEG
jgi:hypothetical protein